MRRITETRRQAILWLTVIRVQRIRGYPHFSGVVVEDRRTALRAVFEGGSAQPDPIVGIGDSLSGFAVFAVDAQTAGIWLGSKDHSGLHLFDFGCVDDA